MTVEDSNVRSLSDKKKKAQAEKTQSSGGSKPTFPQICNMYAHLIDGTSKHFSHEFPEKFLAAKTGKAGHKMILKLGPDHTVEETTLDEVADQIVTFGRMTETTLVCMEAMLTKRSAREAADFWLADARAIEMPAPFAFQSDPQLCFKRLPFDPVEAPHPTWDLFLSNMVGAEDFLAWIGSLLEPKSYMQQYFWLHGAGGDGKGAAIRMLMKLFGRAAISVQGAPQRMNKHWAMPFVNVRLACFTDFDDYSEINKGALKSLTGGDMLWADPKNDKPFQFKPIAKLLYCSNGLPLISSAKSDIRRILLGVMAAGNHEVDPTFEDRLWEEMPFLIWSCIEAYKKACPTHGPIPISAESQAAINDWVSVVEQPFDALFDSEFLLDPLGIISYQDMEKKLRFRFGYNLSTMRYPFLQWLKTAKKVEMRRSKDRNEYRDKLCYFGITLKGN